MRLEGNATAFFCLLHKAFQAFNKYKNLIIVRICTWNRFVVHVYCTFAEENTNKYEK